MKYVWDYDYKLFFIIANAIICLFVISSKIIFHRL